MDDDNTRTQDLKVDINPETTPILYTDQIFMSINEDGLVLDIGQKLGPTNQVRVIARIGMSKPHAKKFLKSLADLLAVSEGQVQTGKKIVH